jgi:ATP-dependent RNA helicase DeaD
MPHGEEAYVHRIGRTGRAGREGAAILLVTPAQRHIVRSLQKATGQTIVQVDAPSIDAINAKRAAEFKQRITVALESRQLPTFQTMLQQLCDETGKPAIEVAAAVAAMHVGKRAFFAKPIEDDFSGARRDSFDTRNRSDRPAREFAPRDFRDERRDSRRDDRSQDSRSGENRTFERPAARPMGNGSRDSVPMQRYRVEVGREHGVQPGNLVGAIANESGLSGSEIGRIDIYDQYSIVGLPEGMPPSVFDSLKNAWVSGRQLRLSLAPVPGVRAAKSDKPFDRKSAVRVPGAHRAAPVIKAPFKKAKKKATS